MAGIDDAAVLAEARLAQASARSSGACRPELVALGHEPDPLCAVSFQLVLNDRHSHGEQPAFGLAPDTATARACDEARAVPLCRC